MDEAKIRHLFTYHKPSEQAVRIMQENRETLLSIAVDLTRLYGESADLTVAIRALHRASMELNYAIIVADEKCEAMHAAITAHLDAAQGAMTGREHVLSKDCWCQPHVEEVENAAR